MGKLLNWNHRQIEEKKDTRRRGIRRRESRPATSVGAVADEDQKKIIEI